VGIAPSVGVPGMALFLGQVLLPDWTLKSWMLHGIEGTLMSMSS
jgi:hypothetical protein